MTHKLAESKFSFNSWAFANKPEMHWLDVSHQKRQSGDSRAKFFVRVDPETLYYGFSIGKPAGDGDVSKNWDNFIQWLANEDNGAAIHAIVLEHEMMVGQKNDSEDRAIIPVKGGWRVGDGKKEHAAGKLAELVEQLSDEDNIVLEVAKKIGKQDALDGGKDIAKDIAELFSIFIPAYGAALTPVH